MAKFKKKEEFVDAIQWLGTEKSMREIKEFAEADEILWQFTQDVIRVITTSEIKKIVLHKGDWIIKTKHGSLDMCEAHMFKIYYEEA